MGRNLCICWSAFGQSVTERTTREPTRDNPCAGTPTSPYSPLQTPWQDQTVPPSHVQTPGALHVESPGAVPEQAAEKHPSQPPFPPAVLARGDDVTRTARLPQWPGPALPRLQSCPKMAALSVGVRPRLRRAKGLLRPGRPRGALVSQDSTSEELAGCFSPPRGCPGRPLSCWVPTALGLWSPLALPAAYGPFLAWGSPSSPEVGKPSLPQCSRRPARHPSRGQR